MSSMEIPEMIVEMHPSVKKVAEFMQFSLPAKELCEVADALAAVAPVIWGIYQRPPKHQIQPISLSEEPIT